MTIKSDIVSETEVINQIKYQQQFYQIDHLEKTKDSVINVLKERGYYTLLINNTKIDKNEYHIFLRLGVKTKSAHIKVNSDDLKIIEFLNHPVKNNFVDLKNEEIQPFLDSISNHLLKSGESFSKVKLINIKITDEHLFSELSISRSTKRAINKTIIEGYKDFPTSFLNHYLKINKNLVFNNQEIDLISEKINRIKFVEEIKKPEALFSKDSTILFLYLAKTNSNSFDGLVNFTTENKNLAFKGYLDFNLINVLNYGEEINVNWKNTGNNKQEFSLKTKLPYIFKTKVTTNIDFNLFRHDSTFVNTKSDISFSYPFNTFINFSVTYSNENSNSTSIKNNVSDYKKNYFGFGVQYNSLKRNQFNFNIRTLFGKRTTQIETEQFLIHFNASTSIEISKRTSFYLYNRTSILASNTYLENELFREGGSNSIRGFNDQSIRTPKFTFLNSEVRLLTQNNDYIYSIQDVGLFNLNNSNSVLYSLGLGYHFIKNTNSIDISYAIGSSSDVTPLSKSSLLSIKFLTLF